MLKTLLSAFKSEDLAALVAILICFLVALFI